MSGHSDPTSAPLRRGLRDPLHCTDADAQFLGDMTVLARTPTQLVLEIENTTTVRMVLLPLFHAGDLQSLYDLEQQPDQTWLYYNLVRIGVGASALTDGHDASAVNRAIAWFRHIAGLLTDQEPPAAR